MQSEDFRGERRGIILVDWENDTTSLPIQIWFDLYFDFNYLTVLCLRSSQKMSFYLYLNLETRNKVFTPHEFTEASSTYSSIHSSIILSSFSILIPSWQLSFILPSFHPIHPSFLLSSHSHLSIHTLIHHILSFPCPYPLSSVSFSLLLPSFPIMKNQ